MYYPTATASSSSVSLIDYKLCFHIKGRMFESQINPNLIYINVKKKIFEVLKFLVLKEVKDRG